jgi:PAS domain S-box-containing protein
MIILATVAVCLMPISLANGTPEPATHPILQVLLLDQNSPDRPGNVRFMKGFRRGLRAFVTEDRKLHAENLGLTEIDATAQAREIDWLAAKYRHTRLSAIIARSEACLNVALGLRDRIAPEAPIVFVGLTSDRAKSYLTEPRITGVVYDLPIADVVATALRLFPKTRQLAHLGHAQGTLNIDTNVPHTLADLARQKGLGMIALCDLPLTEIQSRMANLPPDTVVVYDSYWRDPEGNPHSPADVLDEVSRDAAAPIFGMVDTHVGRGLLGGHCIDLHALGLETAELVGRCANNATIPNVAIHHPRPMFDARLLDRFDIDREKLPADSKILFQEPAFFQQHPVAAIGIGAALLIQALLISALMLQLKRRHQAERRAHENVTQLLRQVADAPIAIVHTVQDSDALVINNTFARLYGWTSQDLPTQEIWFRRIYPDDAYRAEVLTRWQESLEEARRSQSHIPPMAYRITCKDGSEREVEIAASIVGDVVFGTFTDVTDRNRAVAESQEREAELREILESLPFPVAVSRIAPGMVWTDPEAEVIFLNRKHREIFGYSFEDVPTIRDWAHATHPDETRRNEIFAGWDREFQRIIHKGGTLPSNESTITTKDGSRRDVVISAIAVGNRLVTSFNDVTERNRILRELQASEEHFRTIVAKAPVAIGYESPETGNACINEKFIRLFGYTPEEVPRIGTWFELAYPNEAYRASVLKRWQRHVENAVQSGSMEIASDEYLVTCKDGSIRQIEISGIVVAGCQYGWFFDMTERNRAQQEMRELRDQMAHVARVSTLGELAGSLAHELNQPLGAIMRNAETAELLLGRQKPDLTQLRDIIADIHQDNARAGAVLDRIRALVKKQPLQISEEPLADIIRDVVAIVRHRVEYHQITIEIDCPAELPPVRGDRVQLQQVVLNLLINAIDAIGDRKDGSILIQVTQKDGLLDVRVRDNGGGLDPASAANLFTAFFTTKAHGLGMGLVIAKSIVEDHGGRIAAIHHEHDGLEIAFTLPTWHTSRR